MSGTVHIVFSPWSSQGLFLSLFGFLTYITIKKETSRPLGSQLV